MDPTLITGAIALSKSLDKRFGTETTGAKMTDVPGHTRGLISPLAAEVVTFLDIGVNDASTPAILPPLFRWKDGAGSQLTVMYHAGYGAATIVPGTDFAIATVVKDDNAGSHTPEEIARIVADLKKRFAGAEITPTSLTKIAEAVGPHAQSLPVVTQEVGDTWIHGIASDPLKVSRYREVCRLRQKWTAEFTSISSITHGVRTTSCGMERTCAFDSRLSFSRQPCGFQEFGWLVYLPLVLDPRGPSDRLVLQGCAAASGPLHVCGVHFHGSLRTTTSRTFPPPRPFALPAHGLGV